MSEYFNRIEPAFDATRPTKADLARGETLFAGVNCFERGQTQAMHVHRDADKFYFVVSGKARITVGGESEVVGAGVLVWAPAKAPHGVTEVFEPTVLLVAISPPPG